MHGRELVCYLLCSLWLWAIFYNYLANVLYYQDYYMYSVLFIVYIFSYIMDCDFVCVYDNVCFTLSGSLSTTKMGMPPCYTLGYHISCFNQMIVDVMDEVCDGIIRVVLHPSILHS